MTAADPIRQPYARGDLVHELFAACARRRPAAVALIHGDNRTTYGELDAAADALAADLEDRGVGPGDTVPVVLPRSVRLVVAVLAVLKRGAAYTALDPRWPARRLDELLSRIAPRTVIDAGFPVPTPDRRGAARSPSPVTVTGDRPCAVFFTSGSTGEPKGVVSPHRGTVRLFQDCTFARFGTDTVMPLAAAVPWDAFGMELWSVLMNGGTSVVVDEPYLSPAGLRAAVRDHGVNSLSLTTSLFNLFVDEDLPSFAGLAQVFVGAEKVSAEHLRRFLDAHPAVRLVHCYGPAESTIFTTTHRVRRADCARGDGVPIGRPVPNTTVVVWNGTAPCAPGEIGEVLIAGDGLALGYLDDPQLTAERFPTVRLDGADRRVYRTGDLAHTDADGNLYFDGRADRQVKLRGHRVEPGEVEAAAARLPWIRRCAALPVPDPAGGYRGLALYYRAAAGPDDADEALLAHLRRALPHYLVPRWLRRLDAFPLNGNGKLDAQALLSTLTDDTAPAAGAAEPSSLPDGRHERITAAAFGSVLGLASVPSDVSFYELGGDSLGVARLTTRLSAALGTPVPLSAVARNPTVRSLARWLGKESGTGPAGPAMPYGTGAVPLSPIQTFFWARQAGNPDERSYNCSMAWWVDGPLDTRVLAQALADLHRRHEALRAAYHRPDPRRQPIAELPGRPGAPETRTGAHCPDEAAAFNRVLAVLDEPFDLGAGRIWRATTAVGDSTGRTLLGIAVHHVAFDGWSEEVLAAELSHCYGARLAGRKPAFDRPAPSLSTMESHRRAELAAVDLDGQREYWRRQLHGIPPLAIPGAVDHRATPGIEVHEHHLDATAWADVTRAAALAGTTPFTVLLHRYAVALRDATGQRDFGIGVPITRRGTELTVAALGCFIDMLPMRVRLSEPAELADTHRTVVDALAHQDISSAELAGMGGSAGSGRTPLHQTMFALQQNQRPRLRLPGCTTEFVHLPRRHAPFELITEVWPQPHGGALVEITHQAGRVPIAFVDRVVRLFLSPVRSPGPDRPDTHQGAVP